MCWFRHDAEVYVVGCETGDGAASWADSFRQGVTVYGTRRKAQVDGVNLFFLDDEIQNGNQVRYTGQTPYANIGAFMGAASEWNSFPVRR